MESLFRILLDSLLKATARDGISVTVGTTSVKTRPRTSSENWPPSPLSCSRLSTRLICSSQNPNTFLPLSCKRHLCSVPCACAMCLCVLCLWVYFVLLCALCALFVLLLCALWVLVCWCECGVFLCVVAWCLRCRVCFFRCTGKIYLCYQPVSKHQLMSIHQRHSRSHTS